MSSYGLTSGGFPPLQPIGKAETLPMGHFVYGDFDGLYFSLHRSFR